MSCGYLNFRIFTEKKFSFFSTAFCFVLFLFFFNSILLKWMQSSLLQVYLLVLHMNWTFVYLNFFFKKNKIKIKKNKLKNNFKKIINDIQCFLREIPKWGIPNEKVIIPPGNRYVQMIYSAAYILSNTWLRGDVTYHVDFSQVKRVKV